MINSLFADRQVILAATAPMHSVTAVMNLAPLHKTEPTRFLPQEFHATKRGLLPGHDTHTPKVTDHTLPTKGTDMGNISTDHNDTTVPTATGEAAFTEGTHHPPYPATAVACPTLCLMDAPITTHAMTHPIGIVTAHPIFATSPTMSLMPLFHRP